MVMAVVLENENGRCTGKGWAQKMENLVKMHIEKENIPDKSD